MLVYNSSYLSLNVCGTDDQNSEEKERCDINKCAEFNIFNVIYVKINTLNVELVIRRLHHA